MQQMRIRAVSSASSSERPDSFHRLKGNYTFLNVGSQTVVCSLPNFCLEVWPMLGEVTLDRVVHKLNIMP